MLFFIWFLICFYMVLYDFILFFIWFSLCFYLVLYCFYLFFLWFLYDFIWFYMIWYGFDMILYWFYMNSIGFILFLNCFYLFLASGNQKGSGAAATVLLIWLNGDCYDFRPASIPRLLNHFFDSAMYPRNARIYLNRCS